MTEEHITQALAQYQPTDTAIAEMSNRFASLEVTGLDDRAGLKAVHEARLEVRGIRVNVEKKRKELKKDALEYGRRVDGEAKRITTLLLEVEEPLAEKESIVAKEKERLAFIAAEKRKKFLELRIVALTRVGFVGNPLEIQELTEEEFTQLLQEKSTAFREHEEAEERRKADEAIAAQELAEERERFQAEREALEAEQKAAAEKAAETLAKIDREAKLVKDTQAALEQQKAELERQQQEAQRELEIKEAEQLAADKKAAGEFAKLTAEREALAAEQKVARDEKLRVQRELEIKEAKEQAVLDAKRREEEAEAEREAHEAELERLRPQYEKIRRYADELARVPIPDCDARYDLQEIVSRARIKIYALAPTVTAEEEVPD